MLRPAIIEILNENDSYYSFVISVAKRARDIVDEANTNNEILTRKPIQMAVEQFKNKECVIYNDYIESDYKKNIHTYQDLDSQYSETLSSDDTGCEDY